MITASPGFKASIAPLYASGSDLLSSGYDWKLIESSGSFRYTARYDARDVHIFVHIRDVLLQVLPDGGELGSADAHHRELVDLLTPSQIEEGQPNDLQKL